MPVRSTSEPLLPVDDPVALIRSRIREKRIFEARFLCRQLVDAIGTAEKTALERELNGMLAQVAQLRQQAQAFLSQGEPQRAEQLYRAMEEIAIDVPGVAEEQRALAGAEALAARISAKTGASQTLTSENSAGGEERVPPPPVDVAHKPARPRWPSPLWLAAAMVGLVGLVALLLIVRGSEKSSRPSASPAPGAATILIRPLASPPADPFAQSSQPPSEGVSQTPVTTAPAAEVAEPARPVGDPQPAATLPPPPSLQLGALQVEPSEHR